jgi:hypothetical protein
LRPEAVLPDGQLLLTLLFPLLPWIAAVTSAVPLVLLLLKTRFSLEKSRPSEIRRYVAFPPL